MRPARVAARPALARGLRRASRAGCAAVAAGLAWTAGAAAQDEPPLSAPVASPVPAPPPASTASAAQAPLAPMDLYLVGFHPLKSQPMHQMESHHFCSLVNADFTQCVLFDGNDRSARLHGIEYIISARLYATLPAAERKYWHPRNAEILSGQLVAPGVPAAAETALLKQKMNSYGKTWQVWNTGMPGRAGDALPLGPARLAWSFNRDGEVLPALVEERDRAMGVDSEEKRRQRVDLLPLARPQDGVDDLRQAYPQSRAIPGVVDRSVSPVPPPPAASPAAAAAPER